MPSYLFIESREPFGSRDVEEAYRLITDLAVEALVPLLNPTIKP